VVGCVVGLCGLCVDVWSVDVPSCMLSCGVIYGGVCVYDVGCDVLCRCVVFIICALVGCDMTGCWSCCIVTWCVVMR